MSYQNTKISESLYSVIYIGNFYLTFIHFFKEMHFYIQFHFFFVNLQALFMMTFCVFIPHSTSVY